MKRLVALLACLPFCAGATAYLDGKLETSEVEATQTVGAPYSVTFADSAAQDAFGRLRVSNPETLLDTKQLHDKQPLIWDEEISGGTSIHTPTNAATVLAVSSDTEYVIRQTNMRMNYQPGKSQQVLMTFTLGETTPGVIRRVGYFNGGTNAPFTADYDGLYLEDNGTDLAVVVAKTGATTRTPQEDWNLDKMDGTGPSGVTIDVTRAQILIIDFEWLGTGRVRYGFFSGGVPIYFHEELHANIVTSVYMSSPNHSVRYEIRSTGGEGSLMQICSAVMSEGGEDLRGVVRSYSMGNTSLTTSTQNTLYALVGIRLKPSRPDATLTILEKTLLISTTTETLEWSIWANPTVNGTFTYVPQPSSVEIATGAVANTVSGGELLASGFLISGNNASGSGGLASQVNSFLRPGMGIAGDVDEVILCVRPIDGSSTVKVRGGLTWTE